ncbi:MAG: EthD family reductase [Ilumatobacteraceae bacterium]
MTILYPKTDDSTFDMDYYTSTHMPLLAKAMGDGCKGWGAATVMGDQHAAIGWMLIDSMETFNAGMGEHGAEIMADVANYTNQQPEVVLGEVTGGS